MLWWVHISRCPSQTDDEADDGPFSGFQPTISNECVLLLAIFLNKPNACFQLIIHFNQQYYFSNNKHNLCLPACLVASCSRHFSGRRFFTSSSKISDLIRGLGLELCACRKSIQRFNCCSLATPRRDSLVTTNNLSLQLIIFDVYASRRDHMSELPTTQLPN